MSDGHEFQFTEVTTVRGTEQRSIAKKQSEGWELVETRRGTLRTTLRFRRPKPPVPWKTIVVVGGVMVVLLAILGVGAVLEKDDDSAGDSTVTARSTDPTSEPAESTDQHPAPSAAAARTLTVDSSPELANVLKSDSCSDAVAKFADANKDQTIEFDGHVAALSNHDSYKTRYDILVNAGDTDSRGPSFQYRDVNLTTDMKLNGPSVVPIVKENDRYRFTATVEGYERNSCLFQLRAVSTDPL